MIKKYGWQPDLPDHRDFLFEREWTGKLPATADVRNETSLPVDQGPLGSCTGNSSASMVFSVQFIEKYLKPALPSRLGLYWGGRHLEGTVRQDAGAQIRDILKVLANTGAADEKLWPYNIKKFATKPPVKYFNEAKKHKAIAYHRLNNASLVELKSCLAEGYPFVFGFTVYESFESDAVAQSGIVPMPGAEKSLGGHAVLCVGYDDASGRFLVQNSWGTSFGMHGFFTIPYEYLTNTNLADDFWTLRTIG